MPTDRTCIAVLRQIYSVSCVNTSFALITLIYALVIHKIYYCNSILVGISGTLISQLQSVPNAAASLIISTHIFDHITLLLQELHCLKVPERCDSTSVC